MDKICSVEINQQLATVMRETEKYGIKIDTKLLNNLSKKLEKELDKIVKEIDVLLGQKINLNSPKQLSEVLYEKLAMQSGTSGIRYGKLHLSTSKESLEKIKHKHPVIEKILRYREIAKLKNTYVDPLPKLVDENDRLHTHYAIDTSTGRLSSNNPNLQNIPVRTKMGQQIHKAFVAEKGYKLIKADYSQIELRVMAHLAQDKAMMKIFREGGDIHAQTAKEMGCTRRMAKVVNFGVLYGMSAYGLADRLKIPVEEAQFFIDKYFMTFAGVKNYINKLIAQAKKTGDVTTMFGLKRQIPELKSANERVYNFGKRIAINTPVQGSAAEIIKIAMIKLAYSFQPLAIRQKNIFNNQKQIADSREQNILRLRLGQARMLLQIHDELVFEAPKDDIQKTVKIIKETMENAVKLSVPVKVKIEVGNNWQEMIEM